MDNKNPLFVEYPKDHPILILCDAFEAPLNEMRESGVPINLTAVEVCKNQLSNEGTKLKAEFLQLMGYRYSLQKELSGDTVLTAEFNFNSTNQVAELLFDKLELDVIEKTKMGSRSVGKKTLEAYKHEPVVKRLLKIRKHDKLITFLNNIITRYDNGCVYPEYNQWGTRTGRLAVKNPAMQQIPKDGCIRSCIEAPDGECLISVDYSQQELRILAQISQEPYLLEAFKNGEDIHTKTARDFFHTESPTEEQRKKAKMINFGIIYGISPYSFAQHFGIEEKQARGILDKYFKLMPKVKQLIDKTRRELNLKGEITCGSGRKRKFALSEGQRIYSDKQHREAFNFLIQGLAADMMRKAMINVHKKKNDLWGLQARLSIHDEVVYTVKNNFINEAINLIKKEFESVVDFEIPMKVDISYGKQYE